MLFDQIYYINSSKNASKKEYQLLLSNFGTSTVENFAELDFNSA